MNLFIHELIQLYHLNKLPWFGQTFTMTMTILVPAIFAQGALRSWALQPPLGLHSRGPLRGGPQSCFVLWASVPGPIGPLTIGFPPGAFGGGREARWGGRVSVREAADGLTFGIRSGGWPAPVPPRGVAPRPWAALRAPSAACPGAAFPHARFPLGPRPEGWNPRPPITQEDSGPMVRCIFPGPDQKPCILGVI